MRIEAWGRTDRGLKRDSNQDSLLVNLDMGLFIVADGMGGHSGGEIASSLAVSVAQEFLINNRTKYLNSPRELIAKTYQESCYTIFDKSHNEMPELSGMGTTMVLIYLHNNTFYLGNVGDSRIYMFHDPYLWQISEDHSLVNEQLRAGLINEDQVRNFYGKNVITRSVGYEKDVIVDVFERKVSSGDIFLLCSDGLSGMVTDEKISTIMMNSHPSKLPEKLIQEALENGGVDNVTTLVISVP